MILGQYRLVMEKDGAIIIPGPLRELFSDGAYITCGFEQNLFIMSDRTFREKYQRFSGLNIADPDARLLLRLILGNASRLDMDSAGSVFIPQALIPFANLEKEVILVGQGDYIEAWSPERWNKQTLTLMDAEANTGRYAHLDLAMK